MLWYRGLCNPTILGSIGLYEPHFTARCKQGCTECVSNCVSIARKMVGHFKHSQLAPSSLKDQTQLGVKTTRRQQDTATRWNSTFYMLRILLEQKTALPETLNVHQWALIENMLTILNSCEQLTYDISPATATAAEVILSFKALKRLLNKTVATDQAVKTSNSTLSQAVEKRFGHIHSEPLYFLETILDPRYKDRYPGKKKDINLMLQEQFLPLCSRPYQQGQSGPPHGHYALH